MKNLSRKISFLLALAAMMCINIIAANANGAYIEDTQNSLYLSIPDSSTLTIESIEYIEHTTIKHRRIRKSNHTQCVYQLREEQQLLSIDYYDLIVSHAILSSSIPTPRYYTFLHLYNIF